MTKPWRWTSPTRAARGGYGLTDLQRLIDRHTDLPGYDVQDDRDVLMESLIAARNVRKELALEIEALVAEARSRGATWHQIAVALECSPQAAQKKYKDGLSAEGRSRLDSMIEDEIHQAEWSLRHGHTALQLFDGTIMPALSEKETDRLIAFIEDQEGLDEVAGHHRVKQPPTTAAAIGCLTRVDTAGWAGEVGAAALMIMCV